MHGNPMSRHSLLYIEAVTLPARFAAVSLPVSRPTSQDSAAVLPLQSTP